MARVRIFVIQVIEYNIASKRSFMIIIEYNIASKRSFMISRYFVSQEKLPFLKVR